MGIQVIRLQVTFIWHHLLNENSGGPNALLNGSLSGASGKRLEILFLLH